jgi:hypothetical protein
MKRLSAGILFLCCAFFASAEADHPLSLGAGGSLNMAGRQGWSPGGNISIDYKLDEVLTLGLKGGFSVTPGTEEYETVNAIEITLIERFYLLNRSWLRLYFQGNMGAVILREQDYQKIAVLGAGALGVRLYRKYWFAEFSLTYGYPMGADLGVVLGHSFIP